MEFFKLKGLSHTSISFCFKCLLTIFLKSIRLSKFVRYKSPYYNPFGKILIKPLCFSSIYRLCLLFTISPSLVLTIIQVRFLELRLEVEGGVKYSPVCLKLIRVMLETSSLARKYTHISSFRKYTFQYQGFLNFADVSLFLQKISVFWPKTVPLLKTIV